jgi:hypothetical protein
MKTKLSIVILLLLGFSGVYSQSSKQKLNHAKKEASEERKRSFGGQQTENDLKDDRGDLPASQKNKVGDGVRESEQSHDNQSDNSSTQMVKSNQDQSSRTGSADSTKGR